MTVFQIIKRVLDQEYEHLEGSPTKRDKAVTEALERLGKKYRDVLNSGGPDLSDPTVRFAYIYRYSTAHANMAYEFIRSSDVLSELFDKDALTISCVGGGPGSDLLGVFKYLLTTKKRPKLFFYLLDKEEAWGESWADVDQVPRALISTRRPIFARWTCAIPKIGANKGSFCKRIFSRLFTSFLSCTVKKTRPESFLTICSKEQKRARDFFLLILETQG